MDGWAIWITGLPGSGKSTIAKGVVKRLEKQNVKVEYLRMDEVREILAPAKKYTEEERDYTYRSLALVGKYLTQNGINVIADATAYKKFWRDLARELIPNFAEIYVRCPLKICVERESQRKDNLVMHELYKKAMRRRDIGEHVDGLGEVVGIDVPYEEPEEPELIVDSDKLKPEESSDKVFELIKNKFRI